MDYECYVEFSQEPWHMRENIERVSVGGYYLPSGYGHMQSNPQSRPPLLLTYEILGFIPTLLCRKGALLVHTSLLPGPGSLPPPQAISHPILALNWHIRKNMVFFTGKFGVLEAVPMLAMTVFIFMCTAVFSARLTHTHCSAPPPGCRSALPGSFSLSQLSKDVFLHQRPTSVTNKRFTGVSKCPKGGIRTHQSFRIIGSTVGIC